MSVRSIRALLFLLVFPPLVLPPLAVAAQRPLEIKQGEVLYLPLPESGEVASVEGEWQGKRIPFFRRPDGGFSALIGVDLALKPALFPLRVRLHKSGRTEERSYRISVQDGKFKLQGLRLPQEMVDLDEETLARVKEEQGQLEVAMAPVTPEPLWEGRFIAPVDGMIQESFGRRRILNGQPRNPHSGEDINAPLGTPVRASNSGRVILTGEFFFNGKSVLIDHGLGLYTMYFHLNRISVAQGQKVSKGAVLGEVGASGRATGPHLHWGMRLLGARVNPFSLTRIDLR